MIVLAGEAGPLAVGVVHQRGVLLLTPGGNQRTRVELEQVCRPVVGTLDHGAGVIDPSSQQEEIARGEQLVLQVDDLEHAVGELGEQHQVLVLVGLGRQRLILLEGVLQHLAHHVHKVVTERLAILIGVVALREQLGRALELLLVVADVAMTPRRCGADLLVIGTRIDDGLTGALVVSARIVLVRRLEQDVPSLLDLGIGAAVATLHVLARPGAMVNGILLPSHIEEQLVHDGAVVDSLGRDADALHILAVVICLGDGAGQDLGHAVHTHAAAEIVQHVPHPRNALVLHGARLGAQIALKIEHERLVLLVKTGELLLVNTALPLLHNPHGVLIEIDHLLLDGAVNFHDAEALGQRAALVERVDCVVIGHIAEQAALGLIEGSADLVEVIFLAVLLILFGEIGLDHVRAGIIGPPTRGSGNRFGILLLEVRRDLAAKALDDRLDAIGLHAIMNLAGKLGALLEPRVGQRTTGREHILHVEPGIIRRAGEVLLHLGIRVVVLVERLTQDLLLANDVEHEVHAVHGAPVQKGLVLTPVPKRHGVGVGAEVEGVTVLVIGVLEQLLAHRGRRGGHLEVGAEQRVVVHVAEMTQIVVQTGGQADAIIATHANTAITGIGDLEHVLAVAGLAQLKHEPILILLTEDTANEIADLANGLLRGIIGVGRDAIPLLTPFGVLEVLDLDGRGGRGILGHELTVHGGLSHVHSLRLRAEIDGNTHVASLNRAELVL